MSSSYLGHGAKYWADRYFEQHTQTRLPDDPADLSWREKYLALEKECEHYQATLSEMRVEIEYLRLQALWPTQTFSGRLKNGNSVIHVWQLRSKKKRNSMMHCLQKSSALSAISKSGNSIVEKQLNNGPNCIFLSSAIIKKPLPICKRAILKSKR